MNFMHYLTQKLMRAQETDPRDVSNCHGSSAVKYKIIHGVLSVKEDDLDWLLIIIETS
jgi:hypothetical protein